MPLIGEFGRQSPLDWSKMIASKYRTPARVGGMGEKGRRWEGCWWVHPSLLIGC